MASPHPDASRPSTDPKRPAVYEIRIEGHLDATWSDWFPGLAVALQEGGDTVLTGPVADQAALHGLLRRVRDLGLPLVSITRVEPGRAARSEEHPAEGA